MPRYLVEAYCAEESQGIERARRIARTQRDAVRFIRSLFVREDELCLHIVDAPSLAAATNAIQVAEIAYARIVEASEWEADT